jgi:transcriptional regulator with XRE-family HTH domain
MCANAYIMRTGTVAVSPKSVYHTQMITDGQCRMGRAAARWSVRDLAQHAEISAATVNRFETGRVEPNRATIAAIQRALEAAGVEFLPENGVRLKVAQVAPVPGRSDNTSTRKPEPDKPTPRARRAPQPKAAPVSKLEQLRALREQGVR